MNLEEINDRMELLEEVQRWSKYNDTLTAGQRICISQERAALMRARNVINEENVHQTSPSYTLPPELNAKVRHLYDLMQRKPAAQTKRQMQRK